MRIAIDCRTALARKTGDRTYCLNLLRGLANLNLDAREYQFDLLLDAPDTNGVLPISPLFTHRVLVARNSRAWTLFALPRWAKSARPDLVHLQYLAPANLICPFVTAIHDVVWRTFPATFPRLHRAIMNAFMPKVAKRAARIICGTDSARRDIEKYLGAPKNRICVVPYSIDATFFDTVSSTQIENVRRKYEILAPYVLSVGVQQPRKNVERLAQSFEIWKRKFPESPQVLVVCGKDGWGEKTRENSHVKFAGYVRDDELAALYAGADLFAYPSLYEGFGLPILEAMACGCAVLTSNCGAMQEVAGGAAHLINPNSTEEIARGLERVLEDADYRDELRQKGRARAAEFSLEKQALATLQCFRDALNGQVFPHV